MYEGPETSFTDEVGHGNYRYRVKAIRGEDQSHWTTGAHELQGPLYTFRHYVEHFYLQVLGRGSEPGALDIWQNYHDYFIVEADIDIHLAAQDLGRMFFQSAEYAARERTCEEFISDAYRVYLLREPTAGEINTWCVLSERGWNRPEVVSIVARSAEAEELIRWLFHGQEGTPSRTFTASLYAGVLDRLPDQDGLDFWNHFLIEGHEEFDLGRREAAKVMLNVLFESSEFRDNLPPDPQEANRKTVVHLYRALMNRFPMTPEIDYWAGELTNGRWALQELIEYFGNSPEFNHRLGQHF